MSRAARRLHISQPGLSGSLSRLRDLLGDPILVRVGREMQPTARAQALLEPVREALAVLERVTEPAAGFDPSQSERIFTLGLGDGHEMAFTPPVLAALIRAAPRARLVIRPVDVYTVRQALDEELLDAAICILHQEPSWHERVPLFPQGYACVWDPALLTLEPPLTLQRYAELQHLLVTFRGDLSGTVDQVLAEVGVTRRVICGVPRFAALPPLLSTLPALATVPVPVAQHLVRRAGLRACLPPIDIAPKPVGLVYRRRDAAQPELVWFRDLVVRAVEETLAEQPQSQFSERLL